MCLSLLLGCPHNLVPLDTLVRNGVKTNIRTDLLEDNSTQFFRVSASVVSLVNVHSFEYRDSFMNTVSMNPTSTSQLIERLGSNMKLR